MKANPPDGTANNASASRLPATPGELKSTAVPATELVAEFRARMNGAVTVPSADSGDADLLTIARDLKAHTNSVTAGALEDGQQHTVGEPIGNGMTGTHHAAQAALPIATDIAHTMAGNAAAFGALLERHVRALLVSSDGLDHCGAQMLFRLAGDELGGTDLILTRTGNGWLLEANTASQSALDAIRDTAGDLEQRFERHSLGSLNVRAFLRDN